MPSPTAEGASTPWGKPAWSPILKLTTDRAQASNTVIVPPGTGGKVVVTSSAGTSTKLNIDVQGYFTSTSGEGSPGGFVPIAPQRVAASNADVGISGTLNAGSSYSVQVAGVSDIPSEATAVFANVRVFSASEPGGLYAGTSSPVASSWNALAYSDTRRNDSGLSLKLSSNGKIHLRPSHGSIHVIIDVQGYFTSGNEAGGSYVPVSNGYFFDSYPSEAIGPGETRYVDVQGAGGIPASASVAAIATTIQAHNWSPSGSGSGSVALYDPDGARNGTSNVSFAGSYTMPEMSSSIVGVSRDGEIAIHNYSDQTVHLLLAAQGYFTREPETENESDDESIGSTPPCEFDVEIDQSAPTVSNANDSDALTPANLDDAAKPVYEGTVDGQDVELSVLMGSSQADLQAEVAASENDMEELLDESLAEATDGAAETEVGETFAGGTVSAGDLEPVAYTLETPTTIEYGSASSSVCVPQDLSSSDPVSLPVQGGTMMMPTPVNATAATPAGSYPATTSVIRYRTFIPAARATTKWVCGTFKGDNRGFSNYFDRGNRTRASMFFNWRAETIDTTKNVGATHRLAEYGRSAATKTASSKGIKFHSAMMSNTYGKISVSHSVGNPLCSVAGAIRYNLVMEAWKDGSARISGKRGKVPNHEAYVYPKSGAYGKKIFTRKSSKFICLSLNCGDESLWEVAD